MMFRFVVHERVLDFLMCGWHIAQPDLGPPHGNWSVLMAWLCDCKMVEPTSYHELFDPRPPS